ncbi:50S ribosomal protein L32 [Sinimarinibacterium sp. NLF-5-8]|uniref:50S ribosomal protein L32 n=1 Tax=Sinimarinibacterium sp. NLF-5-8 TaxID=2698684 RepID=UPI00137C303E|nr:50S ribosomal protein L32 [Sinimarinibacterium sp. NLF-5-8]QHS08958.1 50S ribosomal protein L32 [Sinimarinibacterium sp. NLF-5-8]
MAVQDSHRSRSVRGHHLAQWARKFKAPALSTDPTTGETHRRHHVTEDGYYRGKKVIDKAVTVDAGE